MLMLDVIMVILNRVILIDIMVNAEYQIGNSLNINH